MGKATKGWESGSEAIVRDVRVEKPWSAHGRTNPGGIFPYQIILCFATFYMAWSWISMVRELCTYTVAKYAIHDMEDVNMSMVGSARKIFGDVKSKM